MLADRMRSRLISSKMPAGDAARRRVGGRRRPARSDTGGARPLSSGGRAPPRSIYGAPAATRCPTSGGRPLIGHDAKPLVEWWLARGGTPPRGRGHRARRLPAQSGADQLPAGGGGGRAARRGAGPGAAGHAARDGSGTLWAMRRARCRKSGLLALYEDIERPLVRVLAAHGAARHPRGPGTGSEEFSARARAARSSGRPGRSTCWPASEFNIGSPKQLATSCSRSSSCRRSGRTKTGYSTDADVLEQLALGHDAARARSSSTARSPSSSRTYADALPTLVNPRTGRIHTSFNQLVAATGRLSSSNPNVAEHPDPHRAGPAHPRGLRAGAGLAVPRRRLLADRAAHPGPRLGRGEPGRGVPARRGHPPPHRVPRSSGSRWTQVTARAARRRQDHELRGHLRRHRVRAVARARHDAEAGAGSTSTSSSPAHPKVKALSRRARWRRAASAATSDAARAGAATCPSCAAATRTCAASASAWPPTRRSRALPPT